MDDGFNVGPDCRNTTGSTVGEEAKVSKAVAQAVEKVIY